MKIVRNLLIAALLACAILPAAASDAPPGADVGLHQELAAAPGADGPAVAFELTAGMPPAQLLAPATADSPVKGIMAIALAALAALAIMVGPSAVAVAKIADNFSIRSYLNAPAGTTAGILTTDGGTTKISDAIGAYANFAFKYLQTVSTSGGTVVDIWASDDAAGATNAFQVKTSGAISAMAIGKEVFLECSAAEIKALSDANGYASAYVWAKITTGSTADRAAVTIIKANPRNPTKGLTAATN
jgi:hypothetical protein